MTVRCVSHCHVKYGISRYGLPACLPGIPAAEQAHTHIRVYKLFCTLCVRSLRRNCTLTHASRVCGGFGDRNAMLRHTVMHVSGIAREKHGGHCRKRTPSSAEDH